MIDCSTIRINAMTDYIKVKDPDLIGEYPALAKAGGGYVWDAVLEYRVWCHPHDRTPETEFGDDYYYAFETFEETLEFSQNNQGCEEPLALILQEEYINEPEQGNYIHVKEQRIAEWPVDFFKKTKKNGENNSGFSLTKCTS